MSALLALAGPGAITAIITQNGNGYGAGLTEAFWPPARAYWRERNPQTEAGMREALTLAAIRWQYLHGVPDETLVSPETWLHDYAQVARPATTWSSWPCWLTTRPTSRSTRPGTPGCASTRS